MNMGADHNAEYVAALERVAALAADLMVVAYDDGPEEIALVAALKELEWDVIDGRKTPVCLAQQFDGGENS